MHLSSFLVTIAVIAAPTIDAYLENGYYGDSIYVRDAPTYGSGYNDILPTPNHHREILSNAIEKREAELEILYRRAAELDVDHFHALYGRDAFLDDNFDDISVLETRNGDELLIYLALCKKTNPTKGNHWMIMTAPRGAEKATWYHITGGPTQNKPFKLEILANKRFRSNGVEQHFEVGKAKAADTKKINAAAQSVPIPSPTGGKEGNCQTWAVGLLDALEKKGFVGPGQASHWRGKYNYKGSNVQEAPTEAILEGTASRPPSRAGSPSRPPSRSSGHH